ncbi:DUF4179 domain-containing protein [Bacillus sp. DX4.1]|uniref:DUF4179 domain-containing protein n=1 Tax=Bacillus sp. DX4.1 TaxID=3055867 RepID=UPI0025A30BFA|nr:DUF4179 domain-containing protein [Bacillus sp. DX4.1]MDM5190243.1 DUF4179 domain-containing protein [Bacillus sp. DX4.1]
MKDSFEMLNDVSIDLNEYEECQLSDVEKKCIKKRLKYKLKKKKNHVKRNTAIVASAAILFCIGMTVDMRGIADIPFVGKKIEDFIDSKGKSLKEYTTTVGQTVYDKGVEVRLDEIIFDDEELLVNSTFKSNEIDLSKASPMLAVYVNGERYSGGGLKIEKLNDYTYTFFYSHNMRDIDMSKELDMKIVFEDIHMMNDDPMIKGEWGFSVKASGVKVMSDIKTIPIHKQFELENGQKIEVTDLKITPISTKLNYKISNKIDYHVFFDAKDQDGNKLEFTGGFTNEKNSYVRFEKLSDNVKKLIFTPDTMPVKERGEKTRYDKVLDEETFEVTIK